MEISNPTEWLVPNILDRLAATTPNAPYAEYPNSPLTYDDGYRCITYAELANAVNCCASFLLDKLGPGKHSVLPYIGPNDLRYIALILGATKAGYTVDDMLELLLHKPLIFLALQHISEKQRCRPV